MNQGGERDPLRQFVEQNPTAMAMLDRNMNYLAVSRRWVQEYRLEEIPLLGRCHYDVFPEIEERWKEVHQRCLLGATEQCDEDEFIRADGEISWISWEVSPWRNEAGTIGGLLLSTVDITQRKQAQEELRKSEAHYRTLLGNIPQNIMIKDRESRYVSINENYARSLGIKPEEVVGKTDDEFFPRELAEKYQQDDKRIMDSGITEDFDEKYSRDGVETWIHTVKAAVRDEFGEVIGILVMFWDVSARKHAEEAHQEMETRVLRQRNALTTLSKLSGDLQTALQDILETSAGTLHVERSSIWRFSDAGSSICCVELYDAARNTTCVGTELNAEDFPAYFEVLRTSDVLAAEDAVSDPRTAEFGDAYLRSHNIGAMLDAPIYIEGKLVGVICNEHIGETRDWTSDERSFVVALANLVALALERHERGIAEDKMRLQAVVMEAAGNAIVITDNAGVIEWVNPAFTTYTGYTAEEAIGHTPGQLIKSGVQNAAFYKDMWQTIRRGDVWQGELTNRRKDGSRYSEFQAIAPVRDRSGEIAHFVGIKLDISARKSLEEELAQAQKMESVGRLAGGVAHDFNNLLTVISGYTEISLGMVEDNPRIHKDLTQVFRAAERAASLTRQLLAFSRRQVLRPEVLDLNRVVDECSKMLRRLVGEDINFTVKLSDEAWSVLADPGQIEQVIMNLVVNARDALPHSGDIIVETSNIKIDEMLEARHATLKAGEYVCVAVSDNGTGMDKATLDQVFEPFFTTKELGKGTGLGLSTVYGIVKQSGGSVFAYSEEGKGTTFKVYLPATHRDSGVEAHKRLVVQDLPGGQESILLVEDEIALRALAKRVLEEVGYSVHTASNGAEALAFMLEGSHKIDLVLTDVIMPNMSGPQLIEALKTNGLEPRVLYMSGYTDTAIVVHRLAEGDIALLNKPFTTVQLTQRVRAELDAVTK